MPKYLVSIECDIEANNQEDAMKKTEREIEHLIANHIFLNAEFSNLRVVDAETDETRQCRPRATGRSGRAPCPRCAGSWW